MKGADYQDDLRAHVFGTDGRLGQEGSSPYGPSDDTLRLKTSEATSKLCSAHLEEVNKSSFGRKAIPAVEAVL